MSQYSINQERDLIIASAKATETTPASFVSGASAGEIQLFTEMGAVADRTSNDAPFYFLYKHLDGRVRRSDVITPAKVINYKQIASVSEVLPSVTVTVATGVDGDLYECVVKIIGDGSLSTEDVVFLTGSFIAVDTNTTNIATGLTASLNAGQTRMGQTYFTITSSGAVITLQSIALPFVAGKKDGRPIDFVVKATEVSVTTNAITGLALAYTAYTPNPASVNFLKDLEWQTRGAFADSYRGQAWPNDFAFASDVVAGSDYALFEFQFYGADEHNHAVQQSPRHLTVAVIAGQPTTDVAALIAAAMVA
jgi:hypothetical protein